MALQSRMVSINFVSGIDGKTDDKLTTKLLTADNAVQHKIGTIEKRHGFVQYGTWSQGVSASPIKVFPFNGNAFVITDWSTDDSESGLNDNATMASKKIQHTQNIIGDRWNITDPVNSDSDSYDACTIRTRQLYADTNSVTISNAAVIGATSTYEGSLIAFIQGKGSASGPLIQYELDSSSKRTDPSIASQFVAAIGNRVVSISSASSTAYILAISGTALYATAANGSITNPTNNVLSVGVDTTQPQLDAVSLSSKIFFATKQASTTGIILGWFDPSNSTTSTTVIPATTTANILTIATPGFSSDRFNVLWCRNTAGNTALLAGYSLTLSQIYAATTITVGVGAYGPGLITQLAACEHSSRTAVSVYFTQSSTTTMPMYTGWMGAYEGGALRINDTPQGDAGLPFCSLASKPFIANGQPHFVVNNSYTGQQAYFVVKRKPSANLGALMPVGRFLYGLAAPNNSASYEMLPAVMQGVGEIYYTTLRRASFFTAQNGSLTFNYSADVARFNFSQTQSIPYAQIANATYLGGGYLSEFDSRGAVESGFLSFAGITSVSTTTTGGSLGAASGAYSVIILKEFTDQTGRSFRSVPSLPQAFTTSTTTSQITIKYSDGPNLHGSPVVRQGQVRYSAFRTQNGGSIYYRELSTSLTSISIYSITGLSFTLTVSDATLAGGDVIYTQGGVIPNWTPDSCDVLFVHQNRLWCNDPSNDGIVRFSNEVVDGEGIAFSQFATVKLPGPGRVTGGQSLDANAIVFRERSIFASSGNGPDETGLNGAFSDGQLLYSDIGCIDQRNLCRFRDGIVFKSPDKGFYLLKRDLQLEYIGAQVENYNSKTVVSSEVVGLAEQGTSVEECRFLCSDGTLLIYNYYLGQWTTGSLPGCTDAVYTGGRYVVVNPTTTVSSTAKVFAQSMSTYVDSFSNTSTTYQMTIETGWIKTADVQGFQRVWRGNVIGESQGPGNISFEIGYDYESSYNETYTLAMSSLTAANYTGGATAAMQADFSPIRQKCQAIRFRIKDVPTAGNTSGVFKLTNISLECGVKKGPFRLPATKGL